ncbi:hypothetical protein ACFJIY_23300 [Pimelobacter simplex]|uniref:hypothetical protein n=1 Tax=Nocardioides simplex TaxID=2045 RepID=UPI00366F10B6
MMLPHKIAALGAAALLAPLALTVAAPAAHADENYAGSIGAAPIGVFYQPNANETCSTTNASVALPYSSVDYVSQSSGPRRFVVHAADVPAAAQLAFYVYRNGVCVAADYQPDPGEESTATVDLDRVVLAKGDRVSVRIISFANPAWRLDILQPGTANAAAVGKGASYVKLPYQVSCASKKATVQVAGKAKARKIKSITFTAGGKKVAAVKGVRARQNIKLKGIPASATSIKAVVKLKGGGKAKVTRAYSACR